MSSKKPRNIIVNDTSAVGQQGIYNQEPETFDKDVQQNQYVQNLEKAIFELKQKLVAADEQIEESKGKLQSFKEELISTKEEMQSTNEEMQSVNESLQIINADYHLKNNELKEAQLLLNSKNQSLLRINADLDHFIHAASHDLLAPLGNIETSIGIMNRFVLSDKKLMEFLNIINQSVKTFRSLITDIATIAKVEGDMLALEIVNVNDLVNDIKWSLEDRITLSAAVITTDLQVTGILFSKKNLRSILFNLVANAIKFKGDRALLVKISTIMEGKHVILKVQDNGIGISVEGQKKIFEMYGRLNQDIEGQGIGLYLARKIVDAANGQLLVESEPGKGSVFILMLSDERPATVNSITAN